MSPMPADPLVGLRALRDDLERLSAASYRAAISYSARSRHRSIRNGQGDAYEYAKARIDAALASLDAVTRAREGQDEPEKGRPT